MQHQWYGMVAITYAYQGNCPTNRYFVAKSTINIDTDLHTCWFIPASFAAGQIARLVGQLHGYFQYAKENMDNKALGTGVYVSM